MPVIELVEENRGGMGKSKKARQRANRRARAAAGGQLTVLSPARMSPSSRSQPMMVAVKTGPTRSRQGRPRRRPGGAYGGNEYLATLLEPETYRGVKVPDPITLASSTWTNEADFTILADSNGAALVLAVPQAVTNSAGASVSYAVVTAGGGSGSNASGANFGAVPSNNPAIVGTIARIRPVSAILLLWSTASPLNTTGSVCSFQLPWNWTANGAGNYLGASNTTSTTSWFATCAALPYSFVDHFAKGGVVRYAPTDPQEFQYIQVQSSTSVGYLNVVSGQLANLANGCSAIGIAVQGAGSGTTLRGRIVVNYEFQPQSDATDFVNRQPSPWNQGWLDQANRFIQQHADTFLKAGSAAFSIGSAALETVLPGLSGLALGAGRKAVRGLVNMGLGGASSSRIPY